MPYYEKILGLDNIVNFRYNWQLETIPALVDLSGSVAREYGVSQTPATFLVEADGLIKRRWDGLALAPQLVFALQSLVGLLEFSTSN